jgi:hypothetical protein
MEHSIYTPVTVIHVLFCMENQHLTPFFANDLGQCATNVTIELLL